MENYKQQMTEFILIENSRILGRVCWTYWFDLSSTAECDQIHRKDCYEFGPTKKIRKARVFVQQTSPNKAAYSRIRNCHARFFLPDKPFKPRTMFVDKAPTLPLKGTLETCSTWICSRLTYKYYTSLVCQEQIFQLIWTICSCLAAASGLILIEMMFSALTEQGSTTQ
jgi:hypothetical protein